MDFKQITLDSLKETGAKMMHSEPVFIESGEENSPIAVEDFTVIIGIAGQISGQLIFGFEEKSNLIIAKEMLGMDVTDMDELTISAVAEFTNVLGGNVTIKLVDAGSKKLGMSPPSIVMGKNMRVSTKVKPIYKYKVKFEDKGEFTLHLALKEKVRRKKTDSE